MGSQQQVPFSETLLALVWNWLNYFNFLLILSGNLEMILESSAYPNLNHVLTGFWVLCLVIHGCSKKKKKRKFFKYSLQKKKNVPTDPSFFKYSFRALVLFHYILMKNFVSVSSKKKMANVPGKIVLSHTSLTQKMDSNGSLVPPLIAKVLAFPFFLNVHYLQ